LRLLASIYARGAAWRRRWYAHHPQARRALARPVISIGNLAVGGSGKTPLVAALARWLLSEGERPSILTRGYARREPADGVLVVSDGERVLEPVTRSGDEPQMLARALAGVPVLASADRHLAGRLAERRFGCTVHLLDDGFQHVGLRRDIDLLLVSAADLEDSVLPTGRLREPVAAAREADAILVAGTPAEASAVAERCGVDRVFQLVPAVAAPRLLVPFGTPMPPTPGRQAVAFAGIARPQRFFDAVRTQGWELARELVFPDHHWFRQADLERIAAAASAANADVVLTTEKDAVRLLALAPGSMPPGWAFLPVAVSVQPAADFAAFVRERLARARDLA
jgi:tetraacyldisaccharide 4'-kinase